MELRHLRYFVRVAEELHFGRAAQELGISQPPLSQQIRLLEEELGVALFERTSRRVALTEAGRLFLHEARATLAQAAHAVDVARRVQAGETGELSIGFATSVPFVPMVGQAFAAFRHAYPHVHLTLSELSRDAQIAALADRRLDIGFIRGSTLPLLPPGLRVIDLLVEPLLVVLRADHPLALEHRPLRISDIAGLPIVFYDQALGAGVIEQMALLFRRHDVEFRIAQEVGGLASLLGLIAAGLGVSILAQSLGALNADGTTYRLLDESDAVSRLWLVHGPRLSPAAARFIGLLHPPG